MGHPVDENVDAAEVGGRAAVRPVPEDTSASRDAEVSTDHADGISTPPSDERAEPETSAPVPEVGGVDTRQVLADLDERPLSEHAEVYEELHTHLQRTLAEIDGG